MDSALCLPFGPLHFHSNKSTTRVQLLTKPHFTFNPSPLSFSKASGFRPQRRQTFGNVVLAIDNKLSKPLKGNRGGDNEIVRVGASLILACAVAMMGCSGKLSPKIFAVQPTIAETLPTEMTDSVFTAKGALKAFLDTTVQFVEAKPKYKMDSKKFDKFPQRPSKEEVSLGKGLKEQVHSLKMEVVQLMKAGKCNEAETQLRKVYERVKNDPEPAYNVEMALVEILIAQGKYDKAFECNCLELKPGVKPGGYQMSDARLPLYKAIVCTMIGDKRANEYWKDFIGKDDPSRGPSGGFFMPKFN